MTTKISDAARNAAVDGVTALLNGGKVEIRTGEQPASVATAASGTLLGTLSLASTAFGAAASGTATAASISDDSSADASGTAGWFRAYDSSDNAVIDGSIGSGQEMTMDDTSVVEGGTIKISSWTISQPAS